MRDPREEMGVELAVINGEVGDEMDEVASEGIVTGEVVAEKGTDKRGNEQAVSSISN